MADSLRYFFLLSCFLFPNLACSCFPVSFSCKNFSLSIKPPFTTTANNRRCGGSHLIKCDGNITLIQFKSQGFWYRLMNISYSEKILIVQDLVIGDPSWGSGCSFLCDYLKPNPMTNVTGQSQILASERQFFNCTTVEHKFSQEFLLQYDHYTPCRDYNFYYTQKLDNRTLGALPTNCLARRPPSFEWRLSFSEDGDLSMLSAGFSHQLELRGDCFDCQVIGNNCSVNGVTRGSICNPAGINVPGHSIAKRMIKIGVMVGIGGLLLAFLSLFCFQCHCRKFGNAIFFVRMETKSARTIEAFLEKHGCLTPKTYTYSEVKKITKSFSDKLGQGGYGTVFKGKLYNGHEVAVKMLSECKGNGEEFINEIASIGRTSHVNIVTLLGFCLEGSKRALIYDFMPNGSLEKYIYGEKSNTTRPLGWETLHKIAIGIAQGLEYLHRGCNARIVHFDIKPHNILLDEEFCPKISDFGLAKLCSGKDSILSIDGGARGTIGYIAPEVFSRNFGVVSSKSDVYSYGMMVLEMAGGRKNINTTVDQSSEIYFPHWIYEHLGRHGTLRDWELSHEIEEIARKMILVGLWCIQTVPDNRPSMNKVVDMLQGSTTDLQMPPKPYLSSPLGSTIGSLAISAT